MELAITAYKLDELHPLARNPRHGDIDTIAQSLATNGQYKPVVVNLGTHTGRENEILAGNHTYYAARQLGWPTIQAVTVDVDETTAKRITLADNRTADLGTYDDTLLLQLLEELPDLDGTGYTEQDLEDLAAFTTPQAATLDELADKFGEADPNEPRTLKLELPPHVYEKFINWAKNYPSNEDAFTHLLTKIDNEEK